MRVLVTGHRGYIGVEMVPVLRPRATTSWGSTSGSTTAATSADLPTRSSRSTSTCVTCTSNTSKASMPSPTSPHCRTTLGDLDADLTYDINLHASVRLARSARAAGVSRYLFASSCSLYGAGGSGLLDERATFNPVTPYGESKVRVEQEVSKLADDTFSPVYLRNATRYGVSRRLRRCCGQQPRWAGHERSRCSCRATAHHGARSSTSATSARRPRLPRGAP